MDKKKIEAIILDIIKDFPKKKERLLTYEEQQEQIERIEREIKELKEKFIKPDYYESNLCEECFFDNFYYD